MKFIEMKKQLPNIDKHLFNITGDDFFLIRQAVQNLKTFFVKDFEDFNFAKIEVGKLNVSEVEPMISTLPIGEGFRLVILENPNADIVKFINTLNFDDSSTILACINADNLKNAEIIDCSKLLNADLTKYILNSLSKVNLKIEEQALDYLIDATNGDMSKIFNELNKIIAYAENEEIITIDMVTNLVANSNSYAIYSLTQAIDNKDLTAYQTILSEMSKQQTMSELFSYMGKYFKRMQYIALNKDDEQLSKILNVKPYAIKISRQNIKKNGIKYYLDLYEKYVDLDYKIKSGKITAEHALYELVF